ncbi:MAG: Fpg/Nei family DNA glycosylase [Opitutales bacterium]|nr:Fpg/Nei family DNA glycosylase [Opitutales bacterium]
MPELAEVLFHSRQWKDGLQKTIKRVETHDHARNFCDTDTAALRKGLTGDSLRVSETYGKKMRFLTESGGSLGIHLGMTGRLVVRRESDPPQKEDRYEHLSLHLAEGKVLGFQDYRQFGRVWWYQGTGNPSWWTITGPQPHEAGFDLTLFKEYLGKGRRTPLKAFLLKQELFPGIGNWMADEILWRARIRPSTRVASLGVVRQKRLYTEIVAVSRWAVKVIGQTHEDPPKDWLFPHRWCDGGFCPQTGKPLRRETIGGRTTCWSPAWQR